MVLRGREEPLRVLDEALASARTGRGRIVILTGEAGIGKTALAEAIASHAEDAGVTWGRAWEFADAPPYFPVWPCLKSVGIAPPDESRAFELWERVLEALAAVPRTTVWIVEDLHAADLGTLDLLTFLAAQMGALRVLLVVTCRPHDPRLDERKLQRLARIYRNGTEIAIDALPEAAIAKIAEDAIGDRISEPALRRLVELTGGNSLFVVECARALRGGALDHLPPTVRQIVIDRVALLPEAARGALDAGAILGREFSAASVARMHAAEVPAVIDELVPALRAGVLRETKPGRFVFTHALVRDAIEDAIAPARRADLHARAEVALDTLGDSPEILVERVRHALAAASAGDPVRTLDLARRVTDLLVREGAFDRAFALQERIASVRADGFLPPASSEDQLAFARIARAAGRSDAMRVVCEAVVASARTAGDAEMFAHAALQHATEIRPGVMDHGQIAMLRESLAMSAPRSPTACRVRARLSTALQPADDYSEPNGLARAALAEARTFDDDRLVLDVLELAGLGMYGSPRAERIAWCEELRDRALAAGDVSKGLNAWKWLATWHVEGGDFAAFGDCVRNSLALSEHAPHPRYRWEPLLLASGYACALGHFAEADRYLVEIAQIAAVIDDEPTLAIGAAAHEYARAKLRRRPDEIAVASKRLEIVEQVVRRGPVYVALIRAGALARIGDLEATRAQLAIAGSQVRLLETDHEAMTFLAEAYALAGTDEDRRRMRDVLAGFPAAQIFGIGNSYEGPLERMLGILDASLGDLERGVERLQRSLATFRANRFEPWIAQGAHELATVLARLGRTAEANALFDEAARIAERHGMRGLGERANATTTTTLQMSLTADVWTLALGGDIARVKDSRGMQLLARLVERPGEEIHVLALASDDGASAPESSAGEQIDERARKAYRKRIAELDEAIARTPDERTATRLGQERAAIIREVARGTGLGGRARQAGSATERARVNVQRRLRDAIARVTEADAAVGTWLDTAVRTGTFCSFRM